MPLVIVPAPYQGPTQGAGRIEVDGATVRACIDAVNDRFPGFREQIFDPGGNVHKFVKLFVNGDEVDRAAVDTPVSKDDEVEVLAAIAGG